MVFWARPYRRQRCIDVKGLDDLGIDHEAMGLVNDGEAVSKALWEEALHSGGLPGAYWAVLTHRHATQGLRQKASGDVHMLSHLVGAAHRADIRRLVALECENQELRARKAANEHAQELAEMQSRPHAVPPGVRAQPGLCFEAWGAAPGRAQDLRVGMAAAGSGTVAAPGPSAFACAAPASRQGVNMSCSGR